jgi:hypothetical protein
VYSFLIAFHAFLQNLGRDLAWHPLEQLIVLAVHPPPCVDLLRAHVAAAPDILRLAFTLLGGLRIEIDARIRARPSCKRSRVESLHLSAIIVVSVIRKDWFCSNESTPSTIGVGRGSGLPDHDGVIATTPVL